MISNSQIPLVSVIIVTYNSEDEIEGCLNSIKDNQVPCTVFVVDNNSSDRTREILLSYSSANPWVKLILNDDNKGLAAANNQPLPYLTTEYTLVLNPDILLQKDSLSIMVNAMRADETIGMLGPLCVFENGEKHVSAHSMYNLFTILFWRTVPHTSMRYLFDNFSSYRRQEVLFVSGACYMIPTDLYKKLKGYDPELFLTVSDVADMGIRIKQMGYKAVYDPQAVITHFGGRSNAPLKFLTQYWGLTGDLYFLKKHKGEFQRKLAQNIFTVSSSIRAGMFRLLASVTGKEKFKDKIKLYADLADSLRKYTPPPANHH